MKGLRKMNDANDKNVKIPGQLSFDNIKTYSVKDRHNLVRIDNLFNLEDPVETYDNPDFNELCARIIAARQCGAPVILSMGAHVIKNNLSRFLIALMKEGFVTHLAGNGACSIHDFELCYNGGTSEDVPTAIAAAVALCRRISRYVSLRPADRPLCCARGD